MPNTSLINNFNKDRVRIGFVIKNGYPVCGGRGVGDNTVKIISLPAAKALAKRIGGVAHEITEIKHHVAGDPSDTWVSAAGEDWGTK